MGTFTKTNISNLWISLFFIPIFISSIIAVELNKLLFFISGIILFRLLKNTYNSPLFFLMIFTSLFYVPFFLFYFFDWQISTYQTFNTVENVRETGRVFFLFQFILSCSLKSYKNYEPITSRLQFKKNNIVFYGALIISIYLIITSLTGETILTTNYGSQQKENSALYEYAIPFILIAFIYSGHDTKKSLILFGVILIFIIKDFLFGGRISGIQMALLAYLMFLDKRINFKYIFLGIIGGVLLLKGFEVIRMSSEFIDNPLSIDIKSIFFFGNDNKIYGSMEGEVVHSSIRLIGMINENIITIQEKIISFFLFLFSALNPGIVLPPLANLTSFLQYKYSSGGGGLFSVYFYVWGGYLGVILCALFISTMLNQFRKTKNMLVLIYTIMLLSTFPRWFAYNPIILLKLAMVPVYLYFLIQQFYPLRRNLTNK